MDQISWTEARGNLPMSHPAHANIQLLPVNETCDLFTHADAAVNQKHNDRQINQPACSVLRSGVCSGELYVN